VIEIRSYRKVFALERRIYRVDRVRLNPGGVPVLGVVYFLAALAASVIAGGLPLVGELAGAVPWYLRDVLLPGATATVLSLIRIEGRPFHLAAHALARYRAGPRYSAGACRHTTSGQRWRPGKILLLPDGSDAQLRRFRYTGPGAVLIAVAHERAGATVEHGRTGLARRGRRPTVVVRTQPDARALDRACVISLRRGVSLLTRQRRVLLERAVRR
jgi:hypothetical protein